ncbi:MAG TPA: hypothetical protein VMW24_06500 [Sedimentisphaerales bacterium]|nr:hypothetical protein [Sedimentisphaerales bacterium]
MDDMVRQITYKDDRHKQRQMTLADKRYLLASIAVKFARYSAGRYEVDELINEAWLSKHVRNAKEVPILWQAGRWAMITYMHQQQRDTPNH